MPLQNPNSVYNLSMYPNHVDDYTARIAGQPINDGMKVRVDYNDYVLARDFNVLRDSILSVQTTLGELPQSTFVTIKGRLDDLASRDDAHYDMRYIGALKSVFDANPSTPIYPTMLGHKHNGAIVGGIKTNPDKISLSAEVSGLLPAANILLTATDASALTASKIYVSDNVSIVNALDSKVNSTGGTITGSLTINEDFLAKGRVEFSSFCDLWTDNMTAGAGGSKVAPVSPINAWENSAVKSQYSGVTTGAWTTMLTTSTTSLRYHRYAVVFRVYVSGAMNDPDGISFRISGNDEGKASVIKNIKQEDMVSGEWNTFCAIFNHEKCTNNKLNLKVEYHTSTPFTYYCDGITVSPAHTAIWG